MAKKRTDLQTILEQILGSRNVYFQPPESVKMKYPAIVYGLDNIENEYANGGVYLSHRRYSVTVIDKDPDSPIVGKVSALPLCRFNRHYEKDNLNHDVFTLFF
ncbi:MAG: hypothetical protein KH921_07255 [Erysipelotrichaceae bacterium]|nr:hypothetical protein [Erysipelotrichaceae bacterium]